MRVGFVVPGGLDRISGGFRYDRLLIAALRARGWTVDVLPLPWLPLLPALAVNLLPAGMLVPGGHDVIIEDELAHPSLLRTNRRLRARGTPIVALVHNLTSRQPSARQRSGRAVLERAYLRGVDGVAAVCASTRADVRALIGRPLPSVLAPAGRDHAPTLAPPIVRSRALCPGPLRVLFVAAVVPAKGLHRLLGAIAALVAEGVDVTLDVAGALDHDRRYVAELRRQSNDATLARRVRLHGLLRGSDLWDLYARSHVLALPSDREAYPLVAIEALGAGLPVLVTDQGGAAELLGAGEHAFCLPPDDRASWIDTLAWFARDRERLAAASLAALARFAALGTWADTASAVAALCARLGSARVP